VKTFFRLSLLLGALFLSVAVCPATDAPAAAASAAPRPRHYLMVLKLTPRLHDAKAWTKPDEEAVDAHFNRLKKAMEAGEVVLAGRTNEPLDRTFGLVVFSAADDASARAFMQADPCVSAGVMTAELHPYGLALLRKN
jgi:uncharacterized protein YciI